MRNGIQPSIGEAAPIAGVSAMSKASPSESTRSGEKVRRASRAPTEDIVDIAEAMISPASLNNSAHATAHTSARVASLMPEPP
ncbi:Uncharacterised protein [Mycobacteroides abscessus subsp. abscessus]|nr:Uncharacterised protein [Mycobacteroides abscessus subsp. abscessus]